MKIWMIWAFSGNGDTSAPPMKWMTDAWDDDSVTDNNEGWRAAVAKARESHGIDNVRIVTSWIDMDVVHQAFQPMDATPRETPTPAAPRSTPDVAPLQGSFY